jgi:hypothetical protein
VYFIWLFSFLLLGGLGWLLIKQVAWLGRLLIGGSVVGCVGLVAWQVVMSVGGGGAPQMHRSQAAVAYTMAHQFLGDTRARKGSVVLLFPPEKAAPTAALDSFYEAFARVMTRFPSISVRESTVPASVSSARNGNISVEEFSTALGSSDGVLAYVSWVGFPVGAEALPVFQNAEERVPIYVFDPIGSLKWLEAVRGGFVSGGVISHPEGAVVKQETGPPTPEAIFSASYRLVTSDNVEKVSSEVIR